MGRENRPSRGPTSPSGFTPAAGGAEKSAAVRYFGKVADPDGQKALEPRNEDRGSLSKHLSTSIHAGEFLPCTEPRAETPLGRYVHAVTRSVKPARRAACSMRARTSAR